MASSNRRTPVSTAVTTPPLGQSKLFRAKPRQRSFSDEIKRARLDVRLGTEEELLEVRAAAHVLGWESVSDLVRDALDKARIKAKRQRKLFAARLEIEREEREKESNLRKPPAIKVSDLPRDFSEDPPIIPTNN